MADAKHTSGPWQIIPAVKIRSGTSFDFAVVNPSGDAELGNWLVAKVRWDANARLIAAAPDLLEALQRIVDFHIGDCPAAVEEVDFAKNINLEIRRIARAAIAKAEGEV